QFGGGRGGGPPGGGGRPGGMRPQSRGPDFFDSRVKDDPELTVLFDPQRERITTEADAIQGRGNPYLAPHDPLFQISFEEQQPEKNGKDDKKPKDGLGQGVTAPRLPVTVEALPELGALVIRAQNKEDLEATLKLIQ